ncbi:MAG: ABC transporter ATP-binding protein [Mycoplasmoidaceae bacterium]|nr:ABC transporter ATP-binding protein [Mycoplasmoidaceae bacterium]
MSMLFGLFKPDTGEIKVNGSKINFKSAIDASKEGIGMVHQHFKLVEVYTLLQNIILGAEPVTKMGFMKMKAARKQIEAIAKKYNLEVDLSTRADSASVGEQQRTEILKLLYRDSEILIFDEPTAVLSDQEIKGFLEILKEFKKQGKTIVIITHKLDEVKAVADRVSVIRKGEYIGTYDVKNITTEKLSEYMIGKKLNVVVNQSKFDYNNTKVCLEVRNLDLPKLSYQKLLAVKDLSFNINRGEILAIAGIEGNGQSEVAQAITGLLKPKKGRINFYSYKTNNIHELSTLSIKQIIDAGVSHVPEDRLRYALIPNESIAYNTVSALIDKPPFSKHGFIKQRSINKYAREICDTWDVRGTHNLKTPVRNLSGGNQQKLVVGREMTKKHSLIVMVQPTRGLDLKAISYIHEKILEDVKKGASVLLISYELDEIFKIADRILVMDRGRIVYESLTKNTDIKTVGSYLSRSAQKGEK